MRRAVYWLGLAAAALLWASRLAAQPSPPKRIPLSSAQTSADTIQLPLRRLAPFRTFVVQKADTLREGAGLWVDPWQGRIVLPQGWRGRALEIAVWPLPPIAADQPLQREPIPQASVPVQDPRQMAEQLRMQDSLALFAREAGLQTTVSTSSLQRNGSIARSITLGSGRDLAVNSDFRLGLNGTIGDIELTAALTDQNIPIQPSGTTQQLTDFDRIFLQLQRGRAVAAFGDLEVIQRGTRFADIYRNVLGLNLAHRGVRSQYEVFGAASKGRFTTQSFQGENGRQGPYRLQGANREPFIIILAGSERVYLNGRLLQRGEDRDYVIEYNTGQLTFTPANLIDANTRIVVDFEYAERNFTRTLVLGRYQGILDRKNRVQLRTSFAREADDPDAPIELTLTAADRARLRTLTGDAGAARIPAVDTVGWDPEEPRYESRDTTVLGVTYPNILVRSSNPQRGVLRVVFSYVGPGQGDYVRAAGVQNGTTYRWVPPVSGQPSGDYAPVRIVPLPRLTQVLSVGLNAQLNRRLSAYVDAAGSQVDQNRFAANDSSTRTGGAIRTGILWRNVPLGRQWQFSTEAHAQYVDANYTNLDRVQPREYGREWNFNDTTAIRATERLAEAAAELRYRQRYRLRIQGGLRSQADSLRTERTVIEFSSSDSARLGGQLNTVYLNTANDLAGTRSRWWRQTGDLFTRLGDPTPGDTTHRAWGRAGAEIWWEDRRATLAQPAQDVQLQAGTFQFYEFKPYLRSEPGRRFQYGIEATLRYDRAFLLGQLREKSQTWKPAVTLRWQPTERHLFGLQASYLHYNLLDNAFATQGLSSQRTLLSNLQGSYTTPKRSTSLTGVYEVSSERLPQREVAYIKVNTGQGQYEWIDYNDNGLQELNEFELSVNPLRANYIRVLAPTQVLVPVNRISLGGSIRFDLRAVLDGKSRWARFGRNLSGLTSIRLEQQRANNGTGLGSYLIQFDNLDRADSALLSATTNLRQDVFVWRNNPRGDLALSWQQARNLQFLNNGSEERAVQTTQVRGRYNLDAVRSLENTAQIGTRRSRATALLNRDFDIFFWSLSPTLNFQFNRRIRLSTGFQYANRRSPGLPSSQAVQLYSYRSTNQLRLNLGGRNSLIGQVDLIQNQLQGNPQGSLQFELLESLQPGRNAIGNLLWVQYLTQTLELTIVYDVRAAQQTQTLHSARLQLKAIF